MNSEIQNLKVVAIVQARLGSTRLPGKILKELSGRPMLWHIIKRLNQSKTIDDVVVATTDLPEDDPVQNFCEINNFSYYRGSSDDVLSRFYETAEKFKADIIIRVTADCPVIDPVIIDKIAEFFFTEKVDYSSNTIIRTLPRGLDTEIFSMASLAKSHNEAKLHYEREHVTPYIYNHPELFAVKNFAIEKDYSFHRWTVDTPDDLKLISEIYSALYPKNQFFLFDDVLKLFQQRPDLININQNVKQKKLGE